MSEWQEFTLGDITSVITKGTTPTTLGHGYTEYGINFVKVESLTDDGVIAVEKLAHIDEKAHDALARSKLQEGDILFSIAGAIGRTAQVTASVLPANTNQAVALIRVNGSAASPRFVHYYLRSAEFQQHGIERVVQTAQANVSLSVLRAAPIRLPPRVVQERIVEVLGAIDDLIENDRRRIALLEEMAQAIYREWFVHFRYRGHEDDELVDSPIGPIPTGWSAPEMQEVCEVVDCLHSKKPIENPNGPGVLLQLFNIAAGGRLDVSRRYRISDDDYRLWTSRIEVGEGDCVVTNVGRVGAVAQVPAGVTAALGRNMTAVRPRAGLMTPSYLLEYFLSPHMRRELAAKTDVGTIMDALNVKNIVRLVVPLPPKELRDTFEGVARPIRRLAEVLTSEGDVLRGSRDALLPKLVTGAIDVSELDLDALFEEPAA